MLLCTDNDRDMNQTHIFTQLTIKHLEVSFPHVSSATKIHSMATKLGNNVDDNGQHKMICAMQTTQKCLIM